MLGIQEKIKRLVDFCGSLILIILLSPLLLVIGAMVKISSPGHALFTQERMGKDQRRFKIYKFRTMRNPPEGTYSVDGVLYKANGDILEPSSTRITPIGRILRKTSLDELPQLFNILNGTMSFVGPRPTLPYQVNNYSEKQKRRFAVRPGVTGLAQVNGRNDLTWSEKIEYDLRYIDKFSLWNDLMILLKTVLVVLGNKGIDFTKEDKMTHKK